MPSKYFMKRDRKKIILTYIYIYIFHQKILKEYY